MPWTKSKRMWLDPGGPRVLCSYGPADKTRSENENEKQKLCFKICFVHAVLSYAWIYCNIMQTMFIEYKYFLCLLNFDIYC